MDVHVHVGENCIQPDCSFDAVYIVGKELESSIERGLKISNYFFYYTLKTNIHITCTWTYMYMYLDIHVHVQPSTVYTPFQCSTDLTTH